MDRMTAHDVTWPEDEASDLIVSFQGVFHWQPAYRAGSDSRHLPLLVWLAHQIRPQLAISLGVGDGGAFFALCEAMQDLGGQAQCFGIDQWAGPDSSALPAIPAGIKQHAQDHHAGLAKLIHADPKAAADHFDLGGVDVLHVDLTRAPDLLEQIQSDWLTLMSDRGVIVLQHNPNALSEASADRLAVLCTQFPNLSLHEENGITVLLVGKTPPNSVVALCDPQSGQAIGMLRWFGAALAERQGHARALQKIAEMDIAAKADADALTALRQQHAELTAKLEQLEAREAAYIAQLAARDTALADLTRQSEAQQQQSAQTSAQLSDTQSALRDMTAAAEALRAQPDARAQAHETALAELQRAAEAREAAHIAQLAARDTALAKARQMADAAEKTHKKHEAQVSKLRHELRVLTKQAEAQLKTAASSATPAIASAQKAVPQDSPADTPAPASKSQAGSAVLGKGLLSGLRRRRSGLPSLRQQVQALQESAYFDSAWYATTYPDCGGQAKAAEHYLREGAFVGNDPGPNFSTTGYYQRNPDVAATQWTALGHYIFFGKAEGRSFEPLSTSDAS